MHDIEPHYGWRDIYVAAEDKSSIFYGTTYSEFTFTKKVYNYYIHPQWDEMGSNTLYLKVLFVEYDEGYAIIELIGEWNDCLHNDVMHFKRNVIDHLIDSGVKKFIVICENVLNFHASDDSYYEEWWEEVSEEGGFICFLNTLVHVYKEMQGGRLQYYVKLGEFFQEEAWRTKKPRMLLDMIEKLIFEERKQLTY